MRRLPMANDAKLRSACDRCHDMKNRCTRSGGIESRCDRCERLDADCVYSKKSQVGRPRTRKQDATSAGGERTSRSRSPGTPTSSRLVPLEDVRLETTPTDGTLQFDFDNSASSSSASSHAAAHFNQHFWDVDLSVNQTEATQCHGMNGTPVFLPPSVSQVKNHWLISSHHQRYRVAVGRSCLYGQQSPVW